MSYQKQQLVQIARSLVDCLLKYKRSDWLFHNIIDDPGSFVEVNLTQMLAYAIYRGLVADGFPANMKNPRDHSGRPFLARWTDSGSCRAFADRRVLTNPASRR